MEHRPLSNYLFYLLCLLEWKTYKEEALTNNAFFLLQ